MKVRIGYFADGPWSHEALNLLIFDPNVTVCFICARFDKTDEYLKSKASDLGIDFYVVEDINTKEFLITIDKYQCNLFVSMSFNQIFKKELFSYPQLGTINCHAGKLPFYRGRNILNWVLINDEKEFGITVHYVDEGVDTGDIILQHLYEINEKDDYKTLLTTAYRECPSILYEAITLIASGKARRECQNLIHPYGSIYSKRIQGDERIDWYQSSREIFNFIRALTSPGPLATTELEGKIVKISKAEMIVDAIEYRSIAGAILTKETRGFLVKTGDTYILITEWHSDCKLSAGRRFS